MFGSFLRAYGRSATKVYSGRGADIVMQSSEIGLILNVWSRGVARWFRWSLSVADSFVCRCLTNSAMLPFPHPAHRTGRAGLPHPALGEDSRNRCSHCL